MTELNESVDDLVFEGGGRASGEWRHALQGDDPSHIRRDLLAADGAFVRLRAILAKWFRAHAGKEHNLAASDYAVQCAYSAGYKRALQDVFKLVNNVTLKDSETPK